MISIDGIYIEKLRSHLLVEHSDNAVKRIFFSKKPPTSTTELAEKIAAHLTKGVPIQLGLDFSSLTPFQKKVLEAIMTIPRGKTVTYGEVAKLIGRPGAARAVGQALAANPFPVLIPCHRVLSRKGLGGYRWGMDLKKKLLAIELANP